MKKILDRAVTALRDVPGIEGIVLGGSRAQGTHRADSDIDIGLYYDGEHRPDTAALSAIAQALDDERRPGLVSPYGGWGPWVDAGAWLKVDGRPVDLILRDLGRVEKELDNAEKGDISANYQPGHPHAFVSVMYPGELAVCQILLDRAGKLAPLQQRAKAYPDAMRRALTGYFGFEAMFSLELAEKALGSDDLYYLTAHVVRAISAMNQALFAVNRQYCLNEKWAVERIEGFLIRPEGYQRRVDAVLAGLGVKTARACEALRLLAEEIRALSQAQ